MCEKKLFCSGNEHGLLQLQIFIALCLGQLRNASRGRRTEHTSHPPASDTLGKEIKMDLAFWLDGRATSMSPHLWQGVLSTSFKSRGKQKRWEGIFPSSKEITDNKISEMKGQNPRKFSLSILKGSCVTLTFTLRLKINIYLDEFGWTFRIFRWIPGSGVLTMRNPSNKQVLSVF